LRVAVILLAQTSTCLEFDSSLTAQLVRLAVVITLAYGAVNVYLIKQYDEPYAWLAFGLGMLALAVGGLQVAFSPRLFLVHSPGWLVAGGLVVAATALAAWFGGKAVLYYRLASRTGLLLALWAFTLRSLLLLVAAALPAGLAKSTLIGAALICLALATVALLQALYRNVLEENAANLEARHEAELYSLQEQKGQAITNLASVVAHEMNNPLTAIMLHTDVLLNSLEDEKTIKSLAVIRKEVARLRNLTGSLGRLARPTRFHKRPCDLRQLLEEIVLLTSQEARRREIELALEAPEGPINLEADSEQLRQVFLNLIQNAMQAQEGGGRITLQMEQRPGEVEVRIEDQGPGISPDKLDKLFEPFFTTKHSSGGTGLGLYVSKRIVERNHGGRLSVESTPGKGTTFYVVLPEVASEG